VEGISVQGAGWSHAAFGRSPEPAGYPLDFVLVQITSAPASQHPVLVIHVFLLSALGPLSGPNFDKKLFGRAQAQPNAFNSRIRQRADPHREKERWCRGRK
jgi:hypothetical protein